MPKSSLPESIAIFLHDLEFTFFQTDLEHLDEAMAALKARHRYTSAERIGEVRKLLFAYLTDVESDRDPDRSPKGQDGEAGLIEDESR